MANKIVVVDFTDNSQKAYTGVPDTILDNKEQAGKLIKARAKRDYKNKEVQTWSVEDGQTYLAPELDNEISNTVDFPTSFKLTTTGKLTLKDVIKTSLQAQRGLTEQEIVQNLRNLASSCLDPIKKKYPSMSVNSAFRKTGEVKKESPYSDHGLGAAADLNFKTTDNAQWVEIATWIKNNIPHKQLLLEYEEVKDPNTQEILKIKIWIHIAYLQKNGQVIKSDLPVATFWNGSPADGGRGNLIALA
jgi:hypothetical protein